MDESKKTRLREELEKLEQMRDELRLHAHLFKADMKDEWEVLEKKAEGLRREIRPVQDAAGQSLDEIGDATGLLMDSVFDGFKRLRDSIR